MLTMALKLKRVYELPEESDGYRVLADRLWPRGIKKEAAQIDIWLKEVAPSTALRKWFNHEPEKWQEFVSKYKSELRDSDVLDDLKSLVRKHKTITLLYGSKDEKYNHAVVLRMVLKK